MLNSLAIAKQPAGKLIAAEADYRAALLLAQKLNFREGIAIYTGNLAELALKNKDFLQAEELARLALPISVAIGRQELIADHNHKLAAALHDQQKSSAALPHARIAVEIFSRLAAPNLAEAQATLAACEAAIAAGE